MIRTVLRVYLLKQFPLHVNFGMLLPYLVKFVIFGIILVLLVFSDKVTTQLRCMW